MTERTHHVQLTLTAGELISLKIALQHSLATYAHMVETAHPESCIGNHVALLHAVSRAQLGLHHPRYEFKWLEPLAPMIQPQGETREFLLPQQCGGRAYVCLNIPTREECQS